MKLQIRGCALVDFPSQGHLSLKNGGVKQVKSSNLECTRQTCKTETEISEHDWFSVADMFVAMIALASLTAKNYNKKIKLYEIFIKI